MDIISLYTNIDNELGLSALRYWISHLRNHIPARISEEFIIEAVQLILENNTFHFNGSYYLQTKGTAMGTKMAPSYVNLVLAYLEENLYNSLRAKDEEYAAFIETNFMRYLDDCFILWNDTKWDLNEFIENLQQLHSDIKYTWDKNSSRISFLDILVLLSDSKVTTDIYYKPTDTHHYLNFKSCHPRHIKNNLPYCMARRICTIVDEISVRDKRLKTLADFFTAQGYPEGLINSGIEKAKSIPITVLRSNKDKEKENILPFVITHNPRNPNMVPMIQSTMKILQTDQKMGKVLQNNKFLVSRRQPSNLKRLLTRARFSEQSQTDCGSKKCGDKRCGTCPYLKETSQVSIKSTGATFYIKSQMTCKSKNVLYIITCVGCGEQYVGKTNDHLNSRVRVHKQHIKTPIYRKLGVSKHIAECSNIDVQFSITPFYKLCDDKTIGTVKEELFIKKFKPKLNRLTLE